MPRSPGRFTTGKPANRITTAQGATIGSVELAGGGIVSRGVVLDIPAVRGVPWLEGADPVFPDDLDAAEAAEGVRVEAGDVLFVRTGFPKRRAERGRARHRASRRCSPPVRRGCAKGMLP